MSPFMASLSNQQTREAFSAEMLSKLNGTGIFLLYYFSQLKMKKTQKNCPNTKIIMENIVYCNTTKSRKCAFLHSCIWTEEVSMFF